jgi:hypothetical protein
MAPDNPTLGFLKRERIAHRLLGNFGFSHVGRSYDGLHFSSMGSDNNVTLVAALPTRGVFQVNGWKNLDALLFYGAVTGRVGARPQKGEWRVLGMYYEDWRDVLKTDNRPAAVRSTDFENVRIGTVGGHYLHAADTRYGAFDALLWGVLQKGVWGRLDHNGAALAVEGGWQPQVLPRIKPWIRAGYFQSSGDDDPLDDDHGTFFQVLPTPRNYARFPFFNLMNVRDAFVMGISRPRPDVTIRGDIHALWLAERNDLWYLGGGAFQPQTFGYTGRPGSGFTGLAGLYDIGVDYQLSPHTTVSGYFGHANGGALTRSIYRGKNANFGYFEVTVRF